MTTPTPAEYYTSLAKTQTNFTRFDQFVNGTAGHVDTDNGPLPNIAQKLLDIDIAVAGTVIGSIPGLSERLTYVTAEMYRYPTDGTDDALAVNRAIAALSATGGGTVMLMRSAGYKALTAITMMSNVTVMLYPGVRFDFNDAPSPAITFYGSVGSEVALSAEVGTGAKTLTFGSAHGFTAGDLLHMVSVRNALSRTDAGGQWLGDGTASLPYAYFSEFHFAQSAPTTTTVSLADSVIFDGYKVNASAETETQRTFSGVKNVTPCSNAAWIGGVLDRSVSGSSLAEMQWAYQCVFNPDGIKRGAVVGKSINIVNSLECTGGGARPLFHTNDSKLNWNYSTMHGNYNRFFVVGSQDCGFINLRDSYSGQTVDFSYSGTAQNTNIRPFCKNSWFINCYEGLTSHPGAYQETWDNLDVVGCIDDAVVIRSYMANLTNSRFYSTVDTTDGTNLTSGGSVTQTFGVVLAYGGARRAKIKNNVFVGFYGAVCIRDSNTLEWQFGNVLSDISDNTVSHCYVGLQTEFSTSIVSNAHRFINYNNNRHSYIGRFMMNLSQYSAGVTARDNQLDGNFRYTGGGSFVAMVNADANCPGLIVTGTKWRRTAGGSYTKYVVAAGSVSDTTAYPKATWAAQSQVYNNEVDFGDVDGVIEQSVGSANYQQLHYLDPANADYTISAGAVEILPSRPRVYYANVDTESAAATDDLDQIKPYKNVVFREGDILYLRGTSAARDVILRDVSTSGASSNGIQTPGNASITLNSSSDVAMLLFAGTHWSVLSSTSTL